jgi:hypothetical protein
VSIDELLNEVEMRIEIASRILDHETELLPIDTAGSLDEADLLAEVDRYLGKPIASSDSEAVQIATFEDEFERVID